MKYMTTLAILLSLGISSVFAEETVPEVLVGNYRDKSLYVQLENKSCNYVTQWMEVPSLKIKKVTFEDLPKNCSVDGWNSNEKKNLSDKKITASQQLYLEGCKTVAVTYSDNGHGVSCVEFKPIKFKL